MGGIRRRSTAAHNFFVTILSSIRIGFVDSYELYASVLRTTIIVLSRVFDARTNYLASGCVLTHVLVEACVDGARCRHLPHREHNI